MANAINATSPQPSIRRVALVGNPNTGKSTLFNALAGMNVRTGNYAGVTIEKKIGRCNLGVRMIDLVDLPGTYSLAPRSPDELVAVEVLTDDAIGEPPIDVIVCVVNATVLQRNLFLVSQLLELGKPTIIALNMIDAANARGMTIDIPRLSQQLGVPVVATSASNGHSGTETSDCQVAGRPTASYSPAIAAGLLLCGLRPTTSVVVVQRLHNDGPSCQPAARIVVTQ
jgi:ferrous iron transport protein B